MAAVASTSSLMRARPLGIRRLFVLRESMPTRAVASALMHKLRLTGLCIRRQFGRLRWGRRPMSGCVSERQQDVCSPQTRRSTGAGLDAGESRGMSQVPLRRIASLDACACHRRRRNVRQLPGKREREQLGLEVRNLQWRCDVHQLCDNRQPRGPPRRRHRRQADLR